MDLQGGLGTPLLQGNSEERSKKRNLQRKSQSSLGIPKQNVGRNMGGNDHSGDISDRNEEYITGNRRKGNPCKK